MTQKVFLISKFYEITANSKRTGTRLWATARKNPATVERRSFTATTGWEDKLWWKPYYMESQPPGGFKLLEARSIFNHIHLPDLKAERENSPKFFCRSFGMRHNLYWLKDKLRVCIYKTLSVLHFWGGIQCLVKREQERLGLSRRDH